MSRFLYNIIFNVLVAAIMSIMMSFALTLINVWVPGTIFPHGFMLMWLRSYLVALAVSIPVTFITISLVRWMLKNVPVRDKP